MPGLDGSGRPYRGDHSGQLNISFDGTCTIISANVDANTALGLTIALLGDDRSTLNANSFIL
jgi:hypothetical protein